MKKGLALNLAATLLLMMCNVPTLSEPDSEDPYWIYNEYINSLLMLQQDIARIHQEVTQEKNHQATYEHMLQAVESTASLIGKAELASHNIHDGLQISLRSRLELLIRFGLSEEQKRDLTQLGYTEEDIDKLQKSLLYYNDYYYRAMTEFSAEQIELFYSMGLTDEQILKLQDDICYRYTKVHRFQQVVKHHQEELLYIQVLMSLITLDTLLELDHQEKGKGDPAKLQNAEEKLLEAILHVSEDLESLEHVKAFSKQVYKAAERNICAGEKKYFLDFFVGLQIHCGALTALQGDPEFGIGEIQSYTGILSGCVASSERPLLSPVENQPSSSDIPVPVTQFAEQTTEFEGQIRESDETNNRGWIVFIIKTSDTSNWDFVNSVLPFILEHKIIPDVIKETLTKLLTHIGFEEGFAAAVGSVGATIVCMILFAPQIGGGWIDSIDKDPTGTFEEIIIDEKTIEYIEMFANSTEVCVATGYWHAIFPENTMKFADIVWQTKYLFKSPWGYYYYYAEFCNEDKWVVVAEDRGFRLGRVVEAFKVVCTEHKCGTEVFETIIEKWKCENFVLVWPV